MITTPALPPKATKNRCAKCGLEAHHPIVLGDYDKPGNAGRCSNLRACARRVLRAKTKAKEKQS